MNKMDLPDFLLHGNIYHAQRLVDYELGLITKKPTWRESLKNYAGLIKVTTPIHEPVEKVIQLIIAGYTKHYPKTKHSVSEHVFDTWWYVIWGEVIATAWQTPMDREVQSTLDKMKNQSVAAGLTREQNNVSSRRV